VLGVESGIKVLISHQNVLGKVFVIVIYCDVMEAIAFKSRGLFRVTSTDFKT